MEQVVFIYKKNSNFVEIQEADARRYTETIDNFILDGGKRLDHSYDYNKDFEHCVTDGEVSEYPNVDCEECISSIDKYLAAKAKREYVEPTPEEKAEQERLSKISELKQKLSETDYVVIKIAEGEATEEEYAEVLAQRKAWREEIRTLQSELESITSS